jgi:diguanylate cyclase (GGDEF)-like protein
LENLAFLDGLTGIANRRQFDEHLEREWRRLTRRSAPLSLLMIDIDHFKGLNDHYGHGYGDDCLRRVAGALADVARRSGDLPARYGGEEFAVVLPDTGTDGALTVAEKIRAAVEALRLPHVASRVAGHVTVSVGVAGGIPRHRGTPRELVNAADRALYRAKSSGRNRIHGEPSEDASLDEH